MTNRHTRRAEAARDRPISKAKKVLRLPLLAERNHKAMDQEIAAQLDKERPAISCTKGCTACCKQLVMLSVAEASLIAIRHPQQVEAAKERLIASIERVDPIFAGKAFDPIEEPEILGELASLWWKEQVDCPFLVDNLCSIYASRPNACRKYFVISPAEDCAKGVDNEVLAWSPEGLSQIVAELWAEETNGRTGQIILGPLPNLVLAVSEKFKELT